MEESVEDTKWRMSCEADRHLSIKYRYSPKGIKSHKGLTVKDKL